MSRDTNNDYFPFQGEEGRQAALALFTETHPGEEPGVILFGPNRRLMPRTPVGWFPRNDSPQHERYTTPAARERDRIEGEARAAARQAEMDAERRQRMEVLAREEEKRQEILQQQQQAMQHEQHRQTRCAACGSNTHLLVRCLWPGPDGIMRGCPECNTLSHTFGDCQRLRSD
ncbi:hypothetical protein FDECE_7620, partial [Fusarium decemcellulare]